MKFKIPYLIFIVVIFLIITGVSIYAVKVLIPTNTKVNPCKVELPLYSTRGWSDEQKRVLESLDKTFDYGLYWHIRTNQDYSQFLIANRKYMRNLIGQLYTPDNVNEIESVQTSAFTNENTTVYFFVYRNEAHRRYQGAYYSFENNDIFLSYEDSDTDGEFERRSFKNKKEKDATKVTYYNETGSGWVQMPVDDILEKVKHRLQDEEIAKGVVRLQQFEAELLEIEPESAAQLKNIIFDRIDNRIFKINSEEEPNLSLQEILDQLNIVNDFGDVFQIRESPDREEYIVSRKDYPIEIVGEIKAENKLSGKSEMVRVTGAAEGGMALTLHIYRDIESKSVNGLLYTAETIERIIAYADIDGDGDWDLRTAYDKSSEDIPSVHYKTREKPVWMLLP